MENEDSAKKAALRQRLEKYLEGKPYRFNPEAETVDGILGAMVKRREKFGEDYCPCRRVTGDKEQDKAIICPCIYHEKELAEDGFCHCHLFSRS